MEHPFVPGVNPWDMEGLCPCPDNVDVHPPSHRLLQEEDGNKTWEIVYMCIVLLIMFVALLSDKVGADMVMLLGLTLCMAARIVTVEEGIAGFANEGLLTVLALFVVAAGIAHTGALDWYMAKLLGRPRSTASAQLKLMIPISIVSAFLNNTPVVVVMIPIVQRWGKNIGISPQQLLIPLSFASILGGTCTLIGTSTNLVVVGLLNERYTDPPTIGLFDLGQYGVPVAIAGCAYILVAAPFLMPGGKRHRGADDGAPPPDGDESILLGARLTKWSPAAGRSVQRSGLRDSGGIYLVSVHRAATGNVHRAVGPDFVLNVDDILYFTGFIESFGDFCDEHGLEVVTNELQEEEDAPKKAGEEHRASGSFEASSVEERGRVVQFSEEHEVFADEEPLEDDPGAEILRHHSVGQELDTIAEGDMPPVETIDVSGDDLGVTCESLVQSDVQDRMRSINRMTDVIRGITPAPGQGDLVMRPNFDRQNIASSTFDANASARIVIVLDTHDAQPLVVIGINARDRPGLLLDISKGLLRLGIQLHHSEASVIAARSMSIWRCEILEGGVSDIEEIWSVLNALLEHEHGVEAIKRRGLKVMRAVVTRYSGLIGQTAAEAGFRDHYKAAIVAVQKGGKNVPESLVKVKFDAGDVLVLQASDDSPLLVRPPSDFYKKLAEEKKGDMTKASSVKSFVNQIRKTFSQGDMSNVATDDESASSFPSKKKKNQTLAKMAKPEGEATKESDDGQAQYDTDFYIPDSGSEGDPEAQGSASGDDIVGESLSDEGNANNNEDLESAWRDLQVYFHDEGDDNVTSKEGTPREFLAAMQVAPKSKLADKTVSQSGLDKLAGVILVSIERPLTRNASVPPLHTRSPSHTRTTIPSDAMSRASSVGASSVDESIAETVAKFLPLSPDEPVQVGDIIWFAGSANSVGDLRKIPGLQSYESEEVAKINEKVHDRRLVQAVVARKGPLVGKTVKDVRFRTRYGAAVIAVHREGKRVHEHPGKVKLQAGDVLLLEAGPTFIARNAENARSFALLSEVEDSAPPRLRLLIPALILAIAMLAVFTAGVASLLICALVAAIIMVCIGILSQQETRDAINWEIYITIACAFGIGTALTNSGVAGGIAIFLVNLGEAIGIGDAGLFGAVYFATFLISNVVTNNAAAALMFPIAMDAAEQYGTDITLMSYCLMLGASASFMSPFGYTTNLLIYGPGGYRYKDFVIFGTPMQLVLWVISVALLAQDTSVLPWYLSWIITAGVLVIIAILRISSDLGGNVLRKYYTRKPQQQDGGDADS